MAIGAVSDVDLNSGRPSRSTEATLDGSGSHWPRHTIAVDGVNVRTLATWITVVSAVRIVLVVNPFACDHLDIVGDYSALRTSGGPRHRYCSQSALMDDWYSDALVMPLWI
jgi:PhoPQ-activated pathogenicity-related protein